ncbi:3-deoxy-D-manno-octulosonic acid transferase [Plebeiibacterium sediminum]|uniref:3-deoxy-D-manno-octulosonic acid transferase n=1 Tax=Plebeiibacterium sediminum TaxID=2992112 RepID=A0AAE3M4I5_9BACT|nr:glycosyltransferase N-terminal domain-containing protein [Plebeiobacterium sediminum]MCW3786744.1 3-deoxy-D-manno-octulosonic acid transferase [Plebeiobacterium sediminum]
MLYLYNTGILFYNLAIRLFSLFNEKGRLLLMGRKATMCSIKQLNITEKTIWVHCASLGEFEQGRPVIEAIKKQDPDKKLVLTFFSPSGYEVRKDYEYADYIFYLPSDRKRNVKKFVDAINPEVSIFVKYEFWHHYLRYLKNSGIKTYIISAIFRHEHVFFKWYGGFYRNILTCFTKLFIQDEESAELLKGIGITNYCVSGDTRFDRVWEIAQASKEYPVLEAFSRGSKVLVGGSSWPAGEKLIAEYLKLNTEIKLLLAPHEIHEEHIKQIEEMLPVSSARYTKLNGVDLTSLKVLIVDTMGMLSSMYRYGDVAYIGGGFGSGIHNTIEASTFGLPVVFGPNYKKYKEACDLIASKGGYTISNQTEFNEIMNHLFQDEAFYKDASEASNEYVEKMRGATGLIIKEITN